MSQPMPDPVRVKKLAEQLRELAGDYYDGNSMTTACWPMHELYLAADALERFVGEPTLTNGPSLWD